MKLETDNERQTILSDDASIYSKREDRDAKTKFSNLHGAEKRRYFFDYIFGKIVIIVVIAALLGSIAYSILKPRPEVMYSVAFIDSIILPEAKEQLLVAATDKFITDPDKQTLTLDYDFYFSAASYDMRSRFMAQLTVGDIDCVVIPPYEMDNYSDSELFVDLSTVLPAEFLAANASKIRYLTNSETGEVTAAGLNISDRLSVLNGVGADRDYYLACIVTSKHQDRFADFLDILPTAPSE